MDIKPKPIKRREMGLTGAIIVLAQVASTFQSNKDLSEEIKSIRNDFKAAEIRQDTTFVRKTEIESLRNQLDKNLTKVNKSLIHVQKELKNLQELTTLIFPEPDSDDLVSCLYFPDKTTLQGGI
jgi:hypothetical protein